MEEIIRIKYDENNHIIIEYNGIKTDKYKLLAMAIDNDNIEQALTLLKVASYYRINDEVYNSLYFAALNTVTDRRLLEKNEPNEFYYQDLFNRIYPKMEDIKIILVENDKKNIPDSWILKNNEKIPVEVKKDKFNDAALSQLERYIKVYNCCHGIAVAKELSVELPSNITFVSIHDLEAHND